MSKINNGIISRIYEALMKYREMEKLSDKKLGNIDTDNVRREFNNMSIELDDKKGKLIKEPLKTKKRKKLFT